MTGKSGFKMRSGNSPLPRLWPFGKKKVKTSGAVLVKPDKKEDSPELIAFKAEQRALRVANSKKKKSKKTTTTKKKNWKTKAGNTTIGNSSNPAFDENSALEKANKRMS